MNSGNTFVSEWFTFVFAGAGFATPQTFEKCARRGKLRGVVARVDAAAAMTSFDIYIADMSTEDLTSTPAAERTWFGYEGVVAIPHATTASLAEPLDDNYERTANDDMGIVVNAIGGDGTVYVRVDLEVSGGV